MGAYYLDSLSAEENLDVQTHLNGCDLCRAATKEIIEVAAALALPDEEDRRSLIDDFGPLHRTGPPSAAFEKFSPEPAFGGWDDDPSPDRRSGEGSAKRTLVLSGKRRIDDIPALSWRPARENRMRSAAPTALLLLAAVTVMTLSAVTLVRGILDAASPATTASATGEAHGIEMSVVAVEDSEGLLIQSDVDGTRPGASYILFAVTTDGRSVPVTRWTATSAQRQSAGRIAQRLSAVASVLVVQPATQAELSVPLHHQRPS
ncbi:hypothetical protein [Actinoplanes sp. NPDC048796]|uniref:hypothetical protein n=1 Tax=unclassified Actinoplanes TaxID=2626549 RepID=UPI0033EEB721